MRRIMSLASDNIAQPHDNLLGDIVALIHNIVDIHQWLQKIRVYHHLMSIWHRVTSLVALTNMWLELSLANHGLSPIPQMVDSDQIVLAQRDCFWVRNTDISFSRPFPCPILPLSPELGARLVENERDDLFLGQLTLASIIYALRRHHIRSHRQRLYVDE